MKFITLLLSIAGLSLTTIACGDVDSIETIDEISMEAGGPEQIVLELDEFSQARNSITGFTPDESYYYFYNDFNQSLYFYSLDQEINTPEKIVKIPLDESINFKSVSDLYIHSMDSIFIFSDYGYEGNILDVFLINDKSEVLGMFDLLNVEEKDSPKVDKRFVYNGNTVFYHKGKIAIPVQITAYTDESKYKPLYVYDLAERKGDYYGEYPSTFELKKFSDETYSLHADYIPELGKIYFSFPYESNLFSFDLSDNSWDEIPFTTDLVALPRAYEGGQGKEKTYYRFSNSWYLGLNYDKASKTLLRFAHIGQIFGENDPLPIGENPPSYASLNGDKVYYQVFAIDPATGEYSVISDIILYAAKLFHPQYGPYQISEINEELGLDAEDYVVFTPLMPKSKTTN